MKVLKRAVAGTLESNDALITLEPYAGGIHIELNSPVEKQYGEQIRQSIESVMNEFSVEEARVIVLDRGAFDCTLRARLETAIFRSQEEGE